MDFTCNIVSSVNKITFPNIPSCRSEACNAASVVITHRYAFISGGQILDSGECSKTVKKNPEYFGAYLGIRIAERIDLLAKNCGPQNDVITPAYLPTIAKHIMDAAPNAEYFVLSIFGPFEDLKFEKLSTVSTHDKWSECPVKKRFTQALRKAGFKEPKVKIAQDVNAAALGEHFFHMVQDHTQNELPSWQRKRILRRSVYVKISQSVNVGIVSGGWLSWDHIPQLGAVKPSKVISGKDPADDEYYIDSYAGFCPVHNDCFEGLVGVGALCDRANVTDLFDIPLDCVKTWVPAAYYTAQLAYHAACSVSPFKIALGGRIFRRPADSHRNSAPKEDFVRLVRQFFETALYQGRDTPTPRFDSLFDEHGKFDINYLGYRECPSPGILGGLLIARSQFLNARPNGIPKAMS